MNLFDRKAAKRFYERNGVLRTKHRLLKKFFPFAVLKVHTLVYTYVNLPF